MGPVSLDVYLHDIPLLIIASISSIGIFWSLKWAAGRFLPQLSLTSKIGYWFLLVLASLFPALLTSEILLLMGELIRGTRLEGSYTSLFLVVLTGTMYLTHHLTNKNTQRN